MKLLNIDYIPGKEIDALGVVKGVCVDAPVKIGDVVVKNIAGTGVDLVATANRERR